MHTHATETYELAEKNWCDPSFSARSTDNSRNMIAVGAEMARVLNEAGINTIQDTTLHDYPSYNGSYEKSNATVRSYLEQYPSIKVVLDVHRDAIQTQDGTRYAPAANINGMRAAQVMIICGADVDGNLPNFKQNLRFAARWQAEMAQLYPGLARPVLFDYRYYNQDLTTGSLLIEMAATPTHWRRPNIPRALWAAHWRSCSGRADARPPRQNRKRAPASSGARLLPAHHAPRPSHVWNLGT